MAFAARNARGRSLKPNDIIIVRTSTERCYLLSYRLGWFVNTKRVLNDVAEKILFRL